MGMATATLTTMATTAIMTTTATTDTMMTPTLSTLRTERKDPNSLVESSWNMETALIPVNHPSDINPLVKHVLQNAHISDTEPLPTGHSAVAIATVNTFQTQCINVKTSQVNLPTAFSRLLSWYLS